MDFGRQIWGCVVSESIFPGPHASFYGVFNDFSARGPPHSTDGEIRFPLPTLKLKSNFRLRHLESPTKPDKTKQPTKPNKTQKNPEKPNKTQKNPTKPRKTQQNWQLSLRNWRERENATSRNWTNVRTISSIFQHCGIKSELSRELSR